MQRDGSQPEQLAADAAHQPGGSATSLHRDQVHPEGLQQPTRGPWYLQGGLHHPHPHKQVLCLTAAFC